MNEDLEIIKKYYGEQLMGFCRTQFSTLLETRGLLPKILLENFEPNRSLYEDLDIYAKSGQFKSYIYQIADYNQEEFIYSGNVESPKELMLKAGYILYECQNEEDIQKFKKYYAKGEELCTFHGGRLDRCHVFFCC